MSINAAIITMLAEPLVKDTFVKILRSRILSYYQLKSSTADTNKLNDALALLKENGLIDKKQASFSDFDKYFLTSEGLEAEKLVSK